MENSKCVLNVGGGSKSIPIPDRYGTWRQVLLDVDSRFGADLVLDARKLIDQPAETYDAVYCSLFSDDVPSPDRYGAVVV